MSLAIDGMMTRKWQHSAARRRCHAKHRAKICAYLGYSIDCIASTRELLRDARAKQAGRLAAWRYSNGVHA